MAHFANFQKLFIFRSFGTLWKVFVSLRKSLGNVQKPSKSLRKVVKIVQKIFREFGKLLKNPQKSANMMEFLKVGFLASVVLSGN